MYVFCMVLTVNNDVGNGKVWWSVVGTGFLNIIQTLLSCKGLTSKNNETLIQSKNSLQQGLSDFLFLVPLMK
jgi:hypothetical protein